MAVTAISRDTLTQTVSIVRMTATNTLAEVGASGYLTAQNDNITALNNGEWTWLETDIVAVSASDGHAFYEFTDGDFTTLDIFPAGNGNVALPVVAGNVPMFDGTDGSMEDSGVAADEILLNALTSGQIFVGSAGGVATGVAMSGDATIVASGALTIANNAITTAKILNANVTLAKLAAGITPSHVIKFANQVTTVGGAAAEAFTVTGAVAATDRAFVQMVDSGTNNVTVLQAVVTNDTLTVTFSADPGNDAIINYQLIRAVS